MLAKEYIEKAFHLADRYFVQLTNWYKDEQDLSIVPESVLEGYLGLLGSLYLTFAYEIEQLDRWYAGQFDIIKFAPEAAGEKPLSDKSVEQKLLLTDQGMRRHVLEGRLKATRFCKESIARSVDARRMAKDYSIKV